MIVLLMLFPVVFLFGYLVQVPLLQMRLGIPFAVALLIGNIASVVLLNWLVPWTSNRFDWWLSASAPAPKVTDAAGAIMIGAALIVMAILFWQLT